MPTVTFTGQADGATLVAAPAAGCFIRVTGGELSSAAAINLVSLKSDSTVIWQTENMKATPFGAAILIDKERTVDAAPGAALKLGASSGSVTGNLQYEIYGMENRQLFNS